MSRFALPKSLNVATWTSQTNGSDKSKDVAKNAVTNALKAIEDKLRQVDSDVLDVSKLAAPAEIAKRADDIAAARKSLDALKTQMDVASEAAKKFVKALGSPDKKITEAAKDIEKDGSDFIKKVMADIAAAEKALAEKQKAVAASAAKAGAAPAPVDKKALASAISYKKLGIKAIVNAQSKPQLKPARFMVVEFKAQVLLYMGLKYDRKLTEAAMKALNAQKFPDDPFIKTWVDPNSKVIWEKDALTLVSDKIPNKLATRLSKSSKLVLGKAYKIRMRNNKGEVQESENKDVDNVSAADLAKELAAMAPDAAADNDEDSVSADSHESDDADAKAPAATAAGAKAPAAAAPIDNKVAIAVKGEWVKARTTASAEVDRLITQIRGLFPKGEHVAQLDEAEKTLKKFMSAFASLDTQLDLVAQQKDKQGREKTIRDLLAKIGDLQKLEKHPVMQNLDDNEVHKIQAGKTLFEGLKRIDATLSRELAQH